MSAEDRTDLAENGMELAKDGTVLAHERRFADWVRTGMAAVGIGLGSNALFRTMEPSWLPKAIATSFCWYRYTSLFRASGARTASSVGSNPIMWTF